MVDVCWPQSRAKNYTAKECKVIRVKASYALDPSYSYHDGCSEEEYEGYPKKKGKSTQSILSIGALYLQFQNRRFLIRRRPTRE